MGKIITENEGRGGIIDIDSLTRNPPKPLTPPKTTAQSITETIERIITMPMMQPILEQAANLMSVYATKIMRENTSQSPRGQAQQLPSPTPVFGAGAKEP